MQYAAVASQKFTCPGLTLAPPAVTWAVSVTTVPAATELTPPPFALTENEVTVAAFVWAEVEPPAAIATKRDEAPAKRMAAWRQIQAIFYRDVPTIKLGEFLQLYGISNKLTGYTPLAWPCFWNVEVTS